LTLSCKLSTPGELLDKVPAPEITSFSINGVAGVISGDTISVNLDAKWQPAAASQQVPKFQHTGKAVTINGVAQKSEATLVDFSAPQTYKIVGFDAIVRTYLVTVSRRQFFPFADTGQTSCSSTGTGDGAMAACPQTVTGQDGDHVNKPTMRSFTGPTQHATFTNDYTTKDNVTGLVWRSCSEGQSGSDCATGSALTYTLSPDTASPQCTTLNSANSGAGYAGRTNWRLPTIEELSTLVNLSNGVLAIDSVNFPATAASAYWSSSTHVITPTTAWRVNFIDGIVGNVNKTTAYGVRCVSNGPAAYAPSRTDNGDGTITDLSNNLIWQKCSMGLANDATCSGTATTVDWTNSLLYCQGLALAGRIWRLPSFRELQSLADYAAQIPAINTTYFPATVANWYWSSSTHVTTPANAWRVSFTDGNVFNSIKSSMSRVRCVTTGP